jgi:hypothetical protein
MAQPVNTFSSYDMAGIREDLSDVIYDISPEETPFYSMAKKKKASNAFFEWQTDTLRASADNAHIEGDDTVATARTATVRLGNYAQIFKDAVVIPGSDDGLDKAGRGAEMALQTLKIAKEQKLDIEKALFANQIRVSGSDTLARRTAGLGAWIDTNTSAGVGGADGSLGTTARTDGTPRALTQALFDTVLQSIWQAGGRPEVVFLSAGQMTTALTFTGNNNQRSNITAASGQVVKTMDVYVTPWGRVEFIPTRENRTRDLFILQKDMWGVGVRRGTRSEALAKTGDNEKRQVVTELGLMSLNEKASGGVFDLS